MPTPSIWVRYCAKALIRASQRRQSYLSRQYATSAWAFWRGTPCDQSPTVSRSGHRVIASLRLRSSSAASGTRTSKGVTAFVTWGSTSSATLSMLARAVSGTNSADKIATPLDAAAARRNLRRELRVGATSVLFSLSFKGKSQLSLSMVTPASQFCMSGRVHKHDFSALDRLDGDSGFARNRDAVTLPDLLVVHHDSSTGGNEIAVSGRGQGICNALPRFERGAEYA